MRFGLFFSRKDPWIELRKNDPLLKRLREIRDAHGVKQVDLAACMKIGEQAIKSIEGGRQQLPGIQPGSGTTLHAWFEAWYRCLHVTAEERREVENLLIVKVLGRLEGTQHRSR